MKTAQKMTRELDCPRDLVWPLTYFWMTINYCHLSWFMTQRYQWLISTISEVCLERTNFSRMNKMLKLSTRFFRPVAVYRYLGTTLQESLSQLQSFHPKNVISKISLWNLERVHKQSKRSNVAEDRMANSILRDREIKLKIWLLKKKSEIRNLNH